jgi:transposase
MDRVVTGLDPHKRSVSVEARDLREVLRATGRFGVDSGNYRAMLRMARQWPRRGVGGRGRERDRSARRAAAAR